MGLFRFSCIFPLFVSHTIHEITEQDVMINAISGKDWICTDSDRLDDRHFKTVGPLIHCESDPTFVG
jgi:hypothetical protein